MSVRIRLTRMGRRNRPYYRVVVADSRSRRDGRFIEQIGVYDPIKREDVFQVQEDRVLHWLRMGAKPSDTVKNLLSKAGIMLKWHLENSNLSEEMKKQELQKWELAQKAKSKAAKKEKPIEEKVESSPASAEPEAGSEEKSLEPEEETVPEALEEVKEAEDIKAVEEVEAANDKEEEKEEETADASVEA